MKWQDFCNKKKNGIEIKEKKKEKFRFEKIRNEQW